MQIKSGQELELTIVDMAFGGQGLAKIPTANGDFIVFVPNALPNQRVLARVVKNKKTYAETKLVRVLAPAPDELTDLPYQPIAGAPYARLPIERQRHYKRSTTLEMFARLSGIGAKTAEIFDEFIDSPRTWHYRNKMEYSFSTLIADRTTGEESEGFALGFKKRGQWWSVEQLEGDSGLFDVELENALKSIRHFCENTGLPAWSPRLAAGFFRYFVVRKSFDSNQLLFNLVVTSPQLAQFDTGAFVNCLMSLISPARIGGIWISTNDDSGDAVKMDEKNAKLLYGAAKIQEKILDLRFDISMESFFQTNPASAERLYSKAMQYVEEALNEMPVNSKYAASRIVMDLFCGTGTIAQLLARVPSVREIVGVDIVEQAILDAKANALLNPCDTPINFFAADVGKFLQEQPQYKNRLSLLVLDPPRAGIAPKTLQKVISLGARAIVYISCNPSTQARDAATLLESGYTLRRLSLVDQFPHTSHIESVALFVRG